MRVNDSEICKVRKLILRFFESGTLKINMKALCDQCRRMWNEYETKQRSLINTGEISPEIT